MNEKNTQKDNDVVTLVPKSVDKKTGETLYGIIRLRHDPHVEIEKFINMTEFKNEKRPVGRPRSKKTLPKHYYQTLAKRKLQQSVYELKLNQIRSDIKRMEQLKGKE